MSRRAGWWLGAGAAIMVLGAVLWWVPARFEEGLRAPINEYLRERTLAMLNETDVAGLSVGFASLDLSFVRRQLVITDIRIRYDHRDSTQYVRFEASTPRATLEGLDLGDMIRHESLRLDAVRVEFPTLSQHRDLAPGGPPLQEAVVVTDEDSIPLAPIALDTLLYNAVAAWLPDEVRQARIELIAFEHGSVSSSITRGARITRDSIGGVTAELRGLGLDSLKHRVFESAAIDVRQGVHVSASSDSVVVDSVSVRLSGLDTAVTVHRIRSNPANPERSALDVAGIRQSNREGRLRVDTVVYGPEITDDGWFRRSHGRRTRIRLTVGGIQVDGTLLRRALGQRVDLRRIDINSLTLDVLADKRGAKAPTRPRVLWPQRLAALDWGVRVDTISLERGLVRYGEISEDRPEAAQLWLSDINALLTNVGNAKGFGAATAPRAVLDAKASLMGEGPVHVHMETPQTPGHFSLAVEGALDQFQAAELNRFVLVAAGVRLTTGRVNEARFAFKVKDGQATGDFSASFDSLHVQLVNRVTHERGFKEKLMGKVANAIVRNSNLPGEKSYRPAVPISYSVKPSDSFWGLIWRSLKTGVLKMMKD
jgi:hypothetical protein